LTRTPYPPFDANIAFFIESLPAKQFFPLFSPVFAALDVRLLPLGAAQYGKMLF
jgi:hypothetical protein